MESKKDLKKLFPHLIKELEGSENKVKIDALHKDPDKVEAEIAVDAETEETRAVLSETAEEAPTEPDKFRHYDPTVVDFIRRCDTPEQVEEIITYLCNKGEITQDVASQLRMQLQKEGVRSFGPKKENDYYFKQSGFC